MEFRELLYRARMGDQESIMEIFEMYRPLLVRNALVDGFFDEDLYQELIVEFLRCILACFTGCRAGLYPSSVSGYNQI